MRIDFKGSIEEYIASLQETITRLDREEINAFLNILNDARMDGRQIFIMGNGGSAATASHYAGDFNKGVSYECDKPRFKFISLNDNIPTLMAYSNDVGYESVFVEPLKNFYNKGDVVIGISGSGNSRNVVNAVEYANSVGAVTVGITGYNGGKLRQIAKHSVNANIDDMQISEDIHMILDHLCMKVLCNHDQKGAS